MVGMHLFSLPKDSKKCDLHHTKDPLKVLPSLQALVEENDQDHFIISAVFHEHNRFAVVTVYVRSLPVGVDPKFDTVVRLLLRLALLEPTCVTFIFPSVKLLLLGLLF